jgi:hypothetical protein
MMWRPAHGLAIGISTLVLFACLSDPHIALFFVADSATRPNIDVVSRLLSDFRKIFTIRSEFLITLVRRWFRDLTWYMR